MIEADIEKAIGMRIMIEVGVGLEKDIIKVISGETIDVVVGQGQDQETVLVGIE